MVGQLRVFAQRLLRRYRQGGASDALATNRLLTRSSHPFDARRHCRNVPLQR